MAVQSHLHLERERERMGEREWGDREVTESEVERKRERERENRWSDSEKSSNSPAYTSAQEQTRTSRAE